jgi:hypothetical protein
MSVRHEAAGVASTCSIAAEQQSAAAVVGCSCCMRAAQAVCYVGFCMQLLRRSLCLCWCEYCSLHSGTALQAAGQLVMTALGKCSGLHCTQ